MLLKIVITFVNQSVGEIYRLIDFAETTWNCSTVTSCKVPLTEKAHCIVAKLHWLSKLQLEVVISNTDCSLLGRYFRNCNVVV